MTLVVEGRRAIYLGAPATLVEDGRELAWAEGHVVRNPAHKWILGRFVEADRPNSNRQLFTLPGLQMARPSIAHAPMNMNHSARRVVGAFTAAELLYPTGDSSGHANPFIEALGVFWRYYFPDEYRLVEAAHAEGRLFYSMECVPRRVRCTGTDGCGAEFGYAGPTSPSYCAHLNDGAADKLLVDPHFTAGAVLVPPVQPGWKDARVHSLVAAELERAEAGYGRITEMVDPTAWEAAMCALLKLAVRRP